MSSLMESMHKPTRDWSRVLRFAIAGGAATAVYLGLGLLLVKVGVALIVSHVAAFSGGFIVSYFGQKYFTFRVRGEHGRTGSRFVMATLFLAAAAAGLTIALRWLGMRPEWVIVTNTVSYPVMSFFVHNAWTFRGRAQ